MNRKLDLCFTHASIRTNLGTEMQHFRQISSNIRHLEITPIRQLPKPRNAITSNAMFSFTSVLFGNSLYWQWVRLATGFDLGATFVLARTVGITCDDDAKFNLA